MEQGDSRGDHSAKYHKLSSEGESEDETPQQARFSSGVDELVKTLGGKRAGGLSEDQIQAIAVCCRFILKMDPEEQIQPLLDESFSVLFEKGIKVCPEITKNGIDPEDLLYFMLERLGCNMNGLPRSVSPNDNNVYKQIDMILTLATTVITMSESDYDKFEKFHTEQNGGILLGHVDIKHRCDLICRLLEEKPLHAEEDISIVFDWLQESGCSSYQQKLRDYCERRRIKVSRQLETCTCCFIVVVLLILCSLMIAIILNLWFIPSIDVNVKDPQNQTYPIGVNTTVKLDCFDISITDLVDVSSLTHIDYATVYAIPEDHISTHLLVLPYIYNKCHSGHSSLPISISYFDCHEPIYTASGGGTLNLFIDLVNSNPDRVSCAMRLFGFSNDSDYISYTRVARDPQDDPPRFVYSSDCNGTNGTHSFSIPLPGNSLRYFVLAVVNQTKVNVSISGNISAYSNAAKYRVDECHLTQSNKYCSIMINPKKSRYKNNRGHLCLFGNTTIGFEGKVNLFATFITRRVYLQKYWISSLPLCGLTLIIFFVLFIIVVAYCRQRRNRRKRITKVTGGQVHAK
ncbi:PREDICTED: uncharacterized protein LOC109591050 [Amphimedon queenslandica]|uniref:Uncharacterized protein n=1 Tax=Amphimedon queenslandica TaxID=400682 RepID=A0A1X7SX58_AMPQE|nr:PREDICTED: uncharacterized protein LOC109591050 [Amphimedon queenslandica]|eukprot:XP_019862418.1 PREDICTED: uncharacterized protein LOC109591050 [Amphimedon queenslandica]